MYLSSKAYVMVISAIIHVPYQTSKDTGESRICSDVFKNKGKKGKEMVQLQ